MTQDRTIKIADRKADPTPIVQTLARAFQDDPALAWILSDAERRRAVLPRFFAVMAQQSHRHGEVLVSPNGEAASLWYPPGIVSDGMVASLWDNLRMVSVFGRSLPRGLQVAEALYARHPKPQPYAYLRYVGVAPEAQGQGWGGAIIRAGIARAASKGQGVLLETATESNVAIYSRLGFAIAQEWDAPDGGPKFWTMIRPAD